MKLQLPKVNTIGWIIIVLFILWIIGVRNINIPQITFFTINGHAITLLNILTLALLVWLVRILGSPFREIVIFLLLLWLLSIFGLFSGLTNIILLIFIVVVLFSII